MYFTNIDINLAMEHVQAHHRLNEKLKQMKMRHMTSHLLQRFLIITTLATTPHITEEIK